MAESESGNETISENEESDYDEGNLPAILDGTFFKITSKVDENKVLATCLMCVPKTKPLKGTLRVTSNFIKHLKVRI